MLTLLVLVCVAAFCSVQAQEPCTAMDPGAFDPISPVLYITLSEASPQDLQRYPNAPQYQGELRLNGVIDSAPNGMIVKAKDDAVLIQPSSYFTFETVSGKNILRLIKPIDRDGPTSAVEDDIDVVTFTLVCSPATNTTIEHYYTVSVLILDQNDNHPMFVNTPHQATVNELLPVGSRVLTVTAADKDLNIAANLTYSILKNTNTVNDGSALFDVDPILGHITVKSPLDFESLGHTLKYYSLDVIVKDGSPTVQFTSSISLRIHVTDGDDQGPGFRYAGCIAHKGVCAWPTYTTNVNALELNEPMGFYAVPDKTGNTISIEAKDMDSLSSQISYSIIATVPAGYDNHFSVESKNTAGSPFHQAVLRQTRAIQTKVLNGLFEIFIKAEENTPARRHAVAMILFKGKIPTGSNDAPTVTTTSPAAGSSGKSDTDKDSTGEFSKTTVGLIVVIAITLTLVVCMAIVLVIFIFRRKQTDYTEKAPLTPLADQGHFNGVADASRL